MTWIADNRRAIGISAAGSAVALGLFYMVLAGAPRSMLMMNATALGIGMVLFGLLSGLQRAAPRLQGPLLLALAAGVGATTLFGVTADGATRWAVVAGLTIQTSLIVAPLLAVSYATCADRWSAAAVALTIVSVALQPDRSVSTMLLCGAAAATMIKRDRLSASLTLLAAVGLAVTLLQPDDLPAVPYVDHILYTAGDAHPAAGIAVWLGSLLLLAPVMTSTRATEPAVLAFAAVWVAAIGCALMGNYPTPLVGYGASAIIGYLLSLLALPGRPDSISARSDASRPAEDRQVSDQGLNFA